MLGLDAGPAPAKPLPLAGETIKDCADCPELVTLPAATILIDADVADRHATPAESPRRRIAIWPGFAIGRREITNSELAAFRAVEGAAAPARCAGTVSDTTSHAPAACVSWDEATAYTAYLSRRTGRHYRLPSAAEWEYAAQLAAAPGPRLASAAGPQDTDVSSQPRLSGFGGGVAELTADCWRDLLELSGETSRPFRPAEGCELHVLKDGAEGEDARWKRAAARRAIGETERSPVIGFRVVRELE
jgi:formylglycine-generating enzyme required for sulfatase activity